MVYMRDNKLVHVVVYKAVNLPCAKLSLAICISLIGSTVLGGPLV